ncbi:MAG: hypothetical protein EAZ15_04710 [Sphingobacteriales bacterium]|nr:MAG: hypothetical protein EAZ15_04710 [Sphingobacteriales bacterium]
MSFNTKTILATLIFCFLITIVKAQNFGSNWPGNNTISFGNLGVGYSKPITIKTLKNFVNLPVKFKVTTLNDSVEFVRSKIYADTVLNQTYLIKVNKKIEKNKPGRETKIYTKETKKIFTELFEGGTLNGVITDSCWLFKVINGQISAYSPIANLKLQTNYLNAFQVADGPIQKFDPKKLEKVIADNPKAKIAFDKKNYFKAIKIYNGLE